MPQIEVTFDIDANGMVNVSAKDRATGKEQRIAISGSSGLAKDEVDRMVRDAEAHAAEDKTRREVIDARNHADSLAWSVEKTVNENRAKLPVGDLSRADAAIAAVREAVKTDDLAAIQRASGELEKASHAIAEALYKGQQAAAGQPGTQQTDAGQPTEGEVVDAEFEHKE